jgi:hypothetical protein
VELVFRAAALLPRKWELLESISGVTREDLPFSVLEPVLSSAGRERRVR